MRFSLVLPLVVVLSACGGSWSLVDQDGDGDLNDCNEADPEINSNAAEVFYDGVDQNCDGADDYDKDLDGHTSVEFGGDDCWDDPDIVPDDFVALNGLAQPGAADVFPGAAADPFYDGIDQDCAGDSDFDQDGDGFDSTAFVKRDGTYGDDCFDAADLDYPMDDSCKDASEIVELDPTAIHPGAQDDLNDGTDADCAGDDLDYDNDGDGFDSCEECDDTNPDAFPSDADEVWYNGVDENCDGNDCDKDEDGFCKSGVDDIYGVLEGGDCWDDPDDVPDDQNGGVLDAQDVYPNGEDTWYDGHDSDCDGLDDFDRDRDGHRTSEVADPSGDFGDDCDDVDPDRYPGALDTWYDGEDSDCAGNDDYDRDADGHRTTSGGAGDDCDDDKALVNPDMNEDCDTSYDDNCDAAFDLRDAEGCDDFWYDNDGDGYGLTSAGSQCWCEAQTAAKYTASTDDDCDDGDTDYHPGATESDCADPNDYNCDGSTAYDDNDADGWAACEECDDDDAGDYPGAPEIVNNGDDEDCDDVDDCYQDLDNDNYGSTTVISSLDLDCADSNEAANDDDCADSVATTFPGAAPNNSTTACMADADGDDWGSTTAPSGGTAGTDCDDASSADHPGATETVNNGDDEDCDSKESCYTDSDADTYGASSGAITLSTDMDCTDAGEANDILDCVDTVATTFPGAAPNNSSSACMADADGDDWGSTTAPSGGTAGTDCVDTSNTTYPGAAPNNSATACMADADGDDYGSTTAPSGGSAGTDCNDALATISPADAEIVNDGIDQDCDSVDSCYTDADDDNFGTTTVRDSTDLDCNNALMAAVSTDCNDALATAYPGAAETTADGVDQDCDGVDTCYVDADGDNYGTTATTDGSTLSCSTGTGAPVSTDCDDTSASKNPGATETTADGIDQDCDSVDQCYVDTDGDNYGTTATTDGSSLSCSSGTGAPVSTDCNDGDATAYPTATETCDGVDDDCDGTVDDGVETTYYLDSDGDGYGSTTTDAACSAPSGYVSNSTDCDDAAVGVHPGAADPTDSTLEDDDCDGLIDEDDVTAGSLVITEFHVGGTAAFEWVEVYNTTAETIALDGWTLALCYSSPGFSSEPTSLSSCTDVEYVTLGAGEVDPGGYLVLLDSVASFTSSPTDYIDFGYTASFDGVTTGLLKDDGGIALTVEDSTGDVLVDRVFWWKLGGGNDWPRSDTESVQFDVTDLGGANPDLVNDDYTTGGTDDLWCLSGTGTAWSSGLYGTPGAANDTCP